MALTCGHILEKPRCWQKRDPAKVTCTVKVTRKLPFCEHEAVMECSKDPQLVNCNVKCGKNLECGHACTRACHECQELSSPRAKETKVPPQARENKRTNHGSCKVECGRTQFCGHGCKKHCHGKEPCPPCPVKCAVKCTHAECGKSCDVPCAACCNPCIWECPHQGQCNLPCGAPCDRLPCNIRCDKNLLCGHQCPSLCGEICPDVEYCVECKDPKVMDMIVDLVMQQTLGEVDVNEDPLLVPSCGHALTMTSLDGMMEMNKYYKERVDRTTGASTFVDKLSLPGGQVSQVCCHMCREPILKLLRYGRRVKYSQLSMRNTKHFQAQAAAMQKAQDDTEVAKIRVEQAHDEFMKAMDKFKADPKEVAPTEEIRTLGKPSTTAGSFPVSNYECIEVYGLPKEQENGWKKLVNPLSKMLTTYKNIHYKAKNSPNKRLFEAAVSHLYRIKDKEHALLEATGGGADKTTTDEIIQACILECGLQADGNGGPSFVDSLQERSNILLLVLVQAMAALDKAGPSSGWYWFVEDLIDCALEHAIMTQEAAIKGIFSRHVTYAGLTRMTLLCNRVKLIGRKSVPTDPVARAARLQTVREQEVLFDEQLTDIASSPHGIREESVRKAKVLEESMRHACQVARGEGVITKEETMEIFRAVSEHMSGSGHWYQCPNGHPVSFN
ncbi:hypothetical protein BGZ96_005342 [Linnemannia gamsii]|uniref:NFX1-type zinc finger-containing protein 1 n=1 Tax=Linnemannia gamsii TaxID=64522 RepID=A0ABQ7KGG9_9FUNG|nr:hypothetical protein BGZ96_005342 [Linnemannia gamsii]